MSNPSQATEQDAAGPVWERRPRSGGEDTHVLRPVLGSMRCLGLISEVRPGAFFAQPAKAPSATRATLEEAKAYVESTIPTGKARAPRAAVTSAPDLFTS